MNNNIFEELIENHLIINEYFGNLFLLISDIKKMKVIYPYESAKILLADIHKFISICENQRNLIRTWKKKMITKTYLYFELKKDLKFFQFKVLKLRNDYSKAIDKWNIVQKVLFMPLDDDTLSVVEKHFFSNI